MCRCCDNAATRQIHLSLYTPRTHTLLTRGCTGGRPLHRCETSDRGASAYRGGDGPLHVSSGTMENPLYQALLEAGASSGQGCTHDLNGFKPEGVGRLDRTTKQGNLTLHLGPSIRLTQPEGVGRLDRTTECVSNDFRVHVYLTHHLVPSNSTLRMRI